MSKILVVEDERIVAEDIQKRLQNLGYTIPSVASSGEEALQKVEEDNPHLVLMDIVLGGEIDGIEAAKHVRSRFGIPVVFLTAYTDEKTLERAKTTEPFGYLVKPFEDRELHAAIEMALYKHKMENTLQSERDKLQALMDGLARTGTGIDIVGSDYRILFQNQTLTERVGDMTGKLCYESYMGLKEPCRVCPMIKAIETNTVESAEVVCLDRRTYEVISAPFPNTQGRCDRAIEVVMDITKHKRTEIQLRNLFEASKLINSTMDMDKIFGFISDSVQELVGFDHFVIFLGSEDRRTVRPAYASEGIKNRVEELSFSYGEGLVGRCMDTGEALLFDGTQEERREYFGFPEMKSQLVIPLIIDGGCVGALHILMRAPDAYTQSDVAGLQPLSEVISSAIRNSKLHNEIKEFSQELERRVEEKSKRTEILLRTRQELQTARSWEKGLITIAENMGRLGFELCGVFLVNAVRKTLEFHFGKGVGLPQVGTSLSLKNTEYYGVKCVQEKKTLFIKNAYLAEGKQLTDAQSCVWVPIVVQDEAFAALTVGNVTGKRVITEEDVDELEILAGMCAAFIDRTRVLVEPVAEKRLKTEFKYWLNPAECYIVTEKKPEKSFEILVDLVTHGIPGFVISRAYPEKIKKKYKLLRTPVLWLSRSGKENAISPDDLPKLNYIIEDFTKKSEESVILLDGVEYLVTQMGFDTVLKFLQELKDLVVIDNSRLIISLHKDALSEKEYSILERESTVV